MRLSAFACAVLIAASLPSVAIADGVQGSATHDTPATATTTDPASMKEDPDQIVCRKLPPPTGSRLGGRRLCMTRRQWQDLQDQSQSALTHVQSVAGSGGHATGP